MSDRSNVVITIRKSDQAKFESICDDPDEVFQGVTPPSEVETIDYTFYKVNCANIGIEKELQKQKIPYDKYWDQANEYGAGSEYHRINKDDESILKEFNVNTEGMVNIDDVIKAFEMGCMEEFIEEMKNNVQIIPWTEQDQILLELEELSQ